MVTLTTTSIRPARCDVAIASLLDKTRQARSKSSPATMDRQADLRTSTPRTTYLPCPGERYNWPAQGGAGQPVDRDNCRPTCGKASNGAHLGLMGFEWSSLGSHGWSSRLSGSTPGWPTWRSWQMVSPTWDWPNRRSRQYLIYQIEITDYICYSYH